MKGWLSTDDQGRSILVRQGTGVVTAVAPVGVPGPDGQHALHRVEIEVTRPQGRPRAIRISTHGNLMTGDPLLAVAAQAEASGDEIAWQIAWHRLAWVPADIDITSLDLANDAQARLLSLAWVGSTAAEAMAHTAEAMDREAEAFADLVRSIDAPGDRGDTT